ncbi:MAG: glutathione S-transferase family protein [Pseudomonadales bacterium]|nr:glutathione S-transferase family protein [Pseudomonadales bacterium]
MQHYYHPMSRAVTTDWMLHELDAEHEQIVIDFTKGENQTPAFRAINPMAKLPTLVDGDVVVTEAAAICLYLADKYIERGMAPPVDSPKRGQYYRYVLFCGSTLEPMFSVDDKEFNAQSVGWGDRERCMASVEAMTPEQGWVLGDAFSAADVVYGGTLDFAVQFGWIKAPSASVAAYVNRIRARPAYRATHDPSWYES